MYNRKVCIFAMLSFIIHRQRSCQMRCIPAFFMPGRQVAIYGVQPRAVSETTASLCIKDLATGSGRRFSVPRAKILYIYDRRKIEHATLV